jgi:hypothetical protein
MKDAESFLIGAENRIDMELEENARRRIALELADAACGWCHRVGGADLDPFLGDSGLEF